MIPAYSEPWSRRGRFIKTDNNQIVLAADIGCNETGYRSLEVLQRIVACVNFCAKVPTEWLINHRAEDCMNWLESYEA